MWSAKVAPTLPRAEPRAASQKSNLPFSRMPSASADYTSRTDVIQKKVIYVSYIYGDNMNLKHQAVIKLHFGSQWFTVCIHGTWWGQLSSYVIMLAGGIHRTRGMMLRVSRDVCTSWCCLLLSNSRPQLRLRPWAPLDPKIIKRLAGLATLSIISLKLHFLSLLDILNIVASKYQKLKTFQTTTCTWSSRSTHLSCRLRTCGIQSTG